MNSSCTTALFGSVVVNLLPLTAGAADRIYDPLAVSDPPGVRTLDITVKDEGRNREIPIRVYLPARTSPQPVLLFSHGLGGSREGYAYLGKHWAAQGYVAVFLQHPGSDSSVWRDKPKDEHHGRHAAGGGLAELPLASQKRHCRARSTPSLEQIERQRAFRTA